MPVLVIGASGFVGSALLDVFGAEAVGTYCERPRPGLRQLDMRDARAVAKLVSEIAPSWILIPAAQPHVDWCEEHESESRAVNVHGPAAVAGVARETGA
ncbi:MAG: sugar nucleotide-binding protein, partial [Armatimonadetes bacterium]|nr:sugar nucleotide-binding protein [Armatimonadota bacterium]